MYNAKKKVTNNTENFSIISLIISTHIYVPSLIIPTNFHVQTNSILLLSIETYFVRYFSIITESLYGRVFIHHHFLIEKWRISKEKI
jgi:hypothetical protein